MPTFANPFPDRDWKGITVCARSRVPNSFLTARTETESVLDLLCDVNALNVVL